LSGCRRQMDAVPGVGPNRIQLVEAGIPRENSLFGGPLYVLPPGPLFSHRAEKGGTGRHLNFIVLN